jgi:hypothetical protein
LFCRLRRTKPSSDGQQYCLLYGKHHLRFIIRPLAILHPMSASMNIFVRVGGAAAATGAVLYAFSNQSAEASAAKKQLQRRPSWEAKFDGSQQREAVAAAASALDEGANKRLQRRPSWAAKYVQLSHRTHKLSSCSPTPASAGSRVPSRARRCRRAACARKSRCCRTVAARCTGATRWTSRTAATAATATATARGEEVSVL